MVISTKKEKNSEKNNRGENRIFLQKLRLQAVKMVHKGYVTIEQASKITGVGVSTIYYRLPIYKKKGARGLYAKSGKKVGKPKIGEKNLTTQEEKVLISVLSKEPCETPKIMLDFGLWTIKMIKEAIHKLFGKKLSIWKVTEIVHRLGFTNQKPLFRAYQQNPEKVEEWIQTRLPEIMDEAEREGRTVYYGDEAGFKSTNHRGKTRAKKGETPIVKKTGARFGVNAISIISPSGEMNFMVYGGTFTADTLLLFLKRLMYKNTKKMTIILDGHPTHKTKKVSQYLEENGDQIKIYILPGYSPELNPDEQVWLHVHNNLKGRPFRTERELKNLVRMSLYSQQKKKNQVANYFLHPDVRRNSDRSTKA